MNLRSGKTIETMEPVDAMNEIARLKKENARIMEAFEKVANQATRYYKQTEELKFQNKVLSDDRIFYKTACEKMINEKKQSDKYIKSLEDEVEEWKEEYEDAIQTIHTLRDRISNPFKSAISSPYK